MAGIYNYAKNKKALMQSLRTTTPYGSKITISRAPSLDKNASKGQKAYYTIVDVKNKKGITIRRNLFFKKSFIMYSFLNNNAPVNIKKIGTLKRTIPSKAFPTHQFEFGITPY
jgi:hypothetical protein